MQDTPSSEAVVSPPDSFTAGNKAPEPTTQASTPGPRNDELRCPQQVHLCCCEGRNYRPHKHSRLGALHGRWLSL